MRTLLLAAALLITDGGRGAFLLGLPRHGVIRTWISNPRNLWFHGFEIQVWRPSATVVSLVVYSSSCGVHDAPIRSGVLGKVRQLGADPRLDRAKTQLDVAFTYIIYVGIFRQKNGQKCDSACFTHYFVHNLSNNVSKSHFWALLSC